MSCAFDPILGIGIGISISDFVYCIKTLARSSSNFGDLASKLSVPLSQFFPISGSESNAVHLLCYLPATSHQPLPGATEWNACTPSATSQLSASANKSNIIPPGGQKLELSLALSKSALISTFYNPSIPLVTYGAAFSTTNRHLCPYLIFVISFTQAGFSNSKFYT